MPKKTSYLIIVFFLSLTDGDVNNVNTFVTSNNEYTNYNRSIFSNDRIIYFDMVSVNFSFKYIYSNILLHAKKRKCIKELIKLLSA